MLEWVGDFSAFLGQEFNETASYAALRKAETIGRPVGSAEWIAKMEGHSGLKLAPAKRGRRKVGDTQ